MLRGRLVAIVGLAATAVACSIGSLPVQPVGDAPSHEASGAVLDVGANAEQAAEKEAGGTDTPLGTGGIDATAAGGAGGISSAAGGAGGTTLPTSSGGVGGVDLGLAGTGGVDARPGSGGGGAFDAGAGGGTGLDAASVSGGAGGAGAGGTASTGGSGGAGGTSGTGGTAGAGGGAGGVSTTGGTTGAGGVSASGGAPTSGGVTGAGGTTVSGGTTGAGGTTATGGTGTGGAPTPDAAPDAADDAACVPEGDPALCTSLGVSCGPASGPDNCGTVRSVNCGACGTCADPIVVPPSGGSFSGTTTGASSRSSSCGGGTAPEKVYAWTPAVSGPAVVSTCGSSLDTVLDVATGTCGSSTTVACNNDSTEWCNGTYTPVTSLVTFNAVAGTTYLVTVDGAGTATGNFNLAVVSAEGSCTVPYEVPPAGGSGSYLMAGNSTDSASCGGSGVDRVHHWRPTVSGTAQVTAVTSYWPATLYVRSGTCKGTEIACDNQTAQWPTNHVSFAVTAGTDYYIWVSHGSYNGPIVCGYTLTTTAPTP